MERLGWRLTALVMVAIVAGLALHFGLSGWTSTSVAAGIDATGRSSLVLLVIRWVGHIKPKSPFNPVS